MSSEGRRRRAQAHAKFAHHCTCGRIVHGNGGKAGHAYMHEQAGDGHHWTTEASFDRLFPNWRELPWPARGARKVDSPRERSS